MDVPSTRLPLPGSVCFESKYAYVSPPTAINGLPALLNVHGKDGWEPVHVQFGEYGLVVGVLLKRAVVRPSLGGWPL